ncbi:MAG: PepSY-associated TM helix domain-containing protein [Rhodospirillaceae bacterium]|nr:PepSY-associated TM helix domain-containing protein [Rhodospirillaceae bacterium]
MVTRYRGAWLWFHRWVGIVLGAAVVLIGVTGSLLVFEKEIDAALNPTLMRVTPAGDLNSFDAIVAAAAAAHPGATPLFFQRFGDAPDASFMVVVRNAGGAETQVFVDPYTLAVLGERSGASAFGLIRNLHANLNLGPVGGHIVGGLSILLVLFFVAGVVLWWPAKGGWGRALTISGGAPPRLLRELHNVFGAWLAVFFMLAAITVPVLVWMFTSPAGQSGGQGGGAGPPRRAAEAPDAAPREPISWQTAAEIGRRAAPGQYVGFILRNPPPRAMYMVRLWPPGAEPRTDNMTNVFVEPVSGRVLRTQTPTAVSARSLLQTDFNATIHSGAIAGLPGRMIMFVAGLGVPVLFVTGVAMWWLKRRRT